jgi:DNA gyrase subunit A
MAYAASRYTEAKLSAVCEEIFRDIDKDTVDFSPNYNGTTTEPVLLPTAFPNVLVTPNQGIAVGMASAVCSFNLKEVCETTIQFIKNPRTNLLKTLPAPDFSTGGELLYKEDEMEALYRTGRGGVRLRAKYRYDKPNGCIEIYEIPYTATVEAIIDKIAALVKAGKVRDIIDVRDETDLNGLKIAIDIRRAADPDFIMRKLYAQTVLQDTFNCNFNILIDGRPRTMGIAEILTEWLHFRTGCLRRQAAFDIGKKRERVHLLEGLSKLLLDIDKAIRIIRQTPSEAQVIPNLMAGFAIDKPQAEFVAEIRLRNLNKEYLLNRTGELDGLRAEIKSLQDLLSDENKIYAIITEQLREIAKKYGKPRMTALVREAEAPKIAEEELIEDYNIKLFLTTHGYVKKIPLSSLRSAGEQYVKDDDAITQEIEATNRSEMLFFTDRCAVYKAKAHDLPDGKASGIGEYLTNWLGLDAGERVVYMAATTDYAGYMLFGYTNGKVAKVPLNGYATKFNRKKLINAYSDKAPLVAAYFLPTDGDIFLMRGGDKAMLLNTALLSPITARNTAGVQVFNLRKNTVMSALRSPPGGLTDEEREYYRADKIPSAGHFIRNQLSLT